MSRTVIIFKYKGREYEVDQIVSDKNLNRIVLPDNTILEVRGWLESLESMPPVPERLVELPYRITGGGPEEVAKIVNGVAAREMK